MTQTISTFKAQEAVFYHIYPLGFCGAPLGNDYSSPMEERLLKVIDWIPHMQSLGVNALYLGPLWESESHGYDTVDYFHVDRRLGNNDTLKAVVKACHEAGIHVILDAVYNHSSRHFFAFKDLQEKGAGSEYRDWYKDVDFSRHSPCGDAFHYQSWDGHYNLAKFDLRNHGIKQHLMDATRFWIEEFDIDGLRLDAADVLDFDFIRELRYFSKSLKWDFWLMGEVVHGDYSRWANPEMLDGVTNYECFKGLYSSHNDANYWEINHSLNRQFNDPGLYRGIELYNFMDNHDVDRVGSLLHKREHLFPELILLFTMPGTPSLYYGSEWGIKGNKGGPSDKDLRPCLDLVNMQAHYPGDICNAISRLSSLRKSLDALKYGGYRTLAVHNEYLVFARETEQGRVIVGLNLREDAVDVTIPLEGGDRLWTDVLNGGQSHPHQGQMRLHIPAYWGVILSA